MGSSINPGPPVNRRAVTCRSSSEPSHIRHGMAPWRSHGPFKQWFFSRFHEDFRECHSCGVLIHSNFPWPSKETLHRQGSVLQIRTQVLFFDECESIFESRDKSNQRDVNMLLTELERHDGHLDLHGTLWLKTSTSSRCRTWLGQERGRKRSGVKEAGMSWYGSPVQLDNLTSST